MKKKKCSKCGKIRLVKEFYKNKRYKDGYGCWCKGCTYEHNKKYYQTEKGKEVAKRKSKKFEQSKKGKERRKRYLQSKKGKEANNRRMRKRRKNDPMFKLSKNMITAMSNSLKNKKGFSQHYCEILGYTFEELVKTLISRFLPGMTIENHGLWEVHHRKPILSFSYKSVNDPEFKKCWALDNLWPLWWEDNLKERGKKVISYDDT